MTSTRAIALSGSIDEQRQLHLDNPLLPIGPGRVRVIVLIEEDVKPDEQE